MPKNQSKYDDYLFILGMEYKFAIINNTEKL